MYVYFNATYFDPWTTAYAMMIGICVANLVMGIRADPSPPLASASELSVLFGIFTVIYVEDPILSTRYNHTNEA